MLDSLRNHGAYLIWCFGREPKETAASAIFAKFGLCRSVPKSTMPAAFISNSTNASRVVLERPSA